MPKKRVNLINFGAYLKDDIISDIEKDNNIEVEQIMVKGTSLNLKKHSTYIQVHDLVSDNKDRFEEVDDFIVNLPGLPIFGAFLITEVHALTGKFPKIVECVKDFANEGMFSDFKYKRLYDLDRERVTSRENYKVR
jgi:hypothetical protein